MLRIAKFLKVAGINSVPLQISFSPRHALLGNEKPRILVQIDFYINGLCLFVTLAVNKVLFYWFKRRNISPFLIFRILL